MASIILLKPTVIEAAFEKRLGNFMPSQTDISGLGLGNRLCFRLWFIDSLGDNKVFWDLELIACGFSCGTTLVIDSS